MTFIDKAAGVFYEPSRVFESIKSTGAKFADWFVPVLILAILGSLSGYVAYSNPDLRYQTMQIMEQSLNKRVTEGKMTAEQAQQAKAAMEGGGSSFLPILTVMGAFFGIFVVFFVVSGVWLVVAKFALKGSITYAQSMGVVGLSNWIAALGLLIGIVLSITMSKLNAGLNLGLFTQAGTLSKSHILLSKLDLFTIWGLVLISIGLGKLADKKTAEVAMWVFGLWIVWGLFSVFVLGGTFA